MSRLSENKENEFQVEKRKLKCFPRTAASSSTSSSAVSAFDFLLLPVWLTGSSLASYWQGEYVSCLLSLLQLMTDVHFQHVMDNCQSQDELKVEDVQRQRTLKVLCEDAFKASLLSPIRNS